MGRYFKSVDATFGIARIGQARKRVNASKCRETGRIAVSVSRRFYVGIASVRPWLE